MLDVDSDFIFTVTISKRFGFARKLNRSGTASTQIPLVLQPLQQRMAELVENMLEGIPIRDNYKRMHDDYVLLKGPPNVTRVCFLVEVAVAATAFAVSFYISITSYTTITKITYEPLGSSYECAVLSPRSDAKLYSSITSELAMFSSARFLLDECLDILDTSGLDVCADDNRKDAILSIQGIAADDTCFDFILPDNYRFCYGSEINTQVSKNLDETYPRQTAGAPALTYENVFYYMNESGTIHALTAPFSDTETLSQYICDKGAVYVVASTEQADTNALYKFSAQQDAAQALLVINGDQIAGVAAADGKAYVLEVKTNKATLHMYDEVTEAETMIDYDCTSGTLETGTFYQFLSIGTDGYIYVICSPSVTPGTPTGILKIDSQSMQARTISTDLSLVERVDGSDTTSYINSINSLMVIGEFAYLATGSPDYNLLRVNLTNADITDAPTMRPTAMPTNGGSPAPTPGGPPPGGRRLSTSSAGAEGDTSQAMQRLVVDTLTNALVQAAGLEGTDTAAALHELLQRSAHQSVQLSGDDRARHATIANTADFSHHARRLAASDNLPTDNLGKYEGAYLHRVDDSFIYFQDGNESFFDPNTQEFGVYTDYPDRYYLATAVQLAYNFAICDGVVVSNWTIATGSSSAFYETCDDINGIYYQNNQFFEVPQSCAGHFSTVEQVSLEALQSCPALEEVYAAFTTTDCTDSFESICQAEYTDNPPYSCTDNEAPDFLTTLGSALANASALWSITAIAISLSLKRAYPGGVLLRKYTDKVEDGWSKKISGGAGSHPSSAAVHPVDDDGEGGDEMDKRAQPPLTVGAQGPIAVTDGSAPAQGMSSTPA